MKAAGWKLKVPNAEELILGVFFVLALIKSWAWKAVGFLLEMNARFVELLPAVLGRRVNAMLVTLGYLVVAFCVWVYVTPKIQVVCTLWHAWTTAKSIEPSVRFVF